MPTGTGCLTGFLKLLDFKNKGRGGGAQKKRKTCYSDFNEIWRLLYHCTFPTSLNQKIRETAESSVFRWDHGCSIDCWKLSSLRSLIGSVGLISLASCTEGCTLKDCLIYVFWFNWRWKVFIQKLTITSHVLEGHRFTVTILSQPLHYPGGVIHQLRGGANDFQFR